ncbi:Uncharacterised protein [uncultured archaeon]|nr:Uncharacterised protein [uncultured archaeon]
MKKRKAKIPAEDRQLFFIFNTLAPRVSDSNDYGTIIGYTVFNSLKNFRLISSSSEERLFHEVKNAYTHFENLIKKIKSSDNYTPHLFELQNNTESALEEYSKTRIPSINQIPESEFEGSWIFTGILDTLFNRGGNHLDRLRRYGLELDRAVQRRGVVKGNRSCLERDYRDLYTCFVREKGDRRD